MPPLAKTVALKQVPLLTQPLFGNLIRELRRLSNMTQGQFAAAIGVSYVTVSRWEAGRIQPSALALRQVQAFIERLSQSTAEPIQVRGKELLALSFGQRQR
ncbi:MAG: helix-turn-helix domain-containing protein [Drouetiella hepatica Uher 2000/2452]|uniref:Helix-turn-helix domain-containing protein n=1 Tax=Drouetiella hepatica Uher 2000/2452 TaxID=904376 RepID=A0A951QGJ2_9CYAN|nr:helix-turn-helix domain-containing protein [Drouetiella hepatica Uher 2000/2452]